MKIKLPLGLIIVIDDTYNANPASMRAAFANLNLRKTEGRKILILGVVKINTDEIKIILKKFIIPTILWVIDKREDMCHL